MFLNRALSSADFPLEVNRDYRVNIIAKGMFFECWIDGEFVLFGYDYKNRLKVGSLAIILWEDDGKTDIRAKILMEPNDLVPLEES